jgi:hypothetical protein
MSTQVQFRRGTTTQNNAFTGAIGEISVDTDLKTIRLHDGTTAGGGSAMLNNVSSQTALNKTFSTGSVWQGNAVALAYGGTGSSLSAVAGAVAYSTSGGLSLSSSGTSGQLLVSGGTGAPTWVSASTISAGTSALAATATNIAGGSAGQLMIQADTGLTSFITAGSAGTFLKSAGAGYAPTWASADVTIGTTTIALGGTSLSLAGVSTITTTGNVTVGGNLIVNGTTTTINATTVQVADKNIELGLVGTPTDTTAEGGGITLKGAIDKTIIWGAATGWQLDDSIKTTRAFIATTSSTTPTPILTAATSTYRSGGLQIQVTNGAAYKLANLMFVHDGTTVSLSENYLVGMDVQTASTNTAFTASISAGVLTVYATASSGTSVVKGEATLFKV